MRKLKAFRKALIFYIRHFLDLRVTITEGNMDFIPAHVAHKWRNDKDEPVEVILIMFGEGA